MSASPLLLAHIVGGIASLFAGAAAIVLRKGSRRHAYAGNIFVVSMVLLAGSGVILAIEKSQPGNVFGGALTLYLVATSWLTARSRGRVSRLWDWLALAVSVGIAGFGATYATEALRSATGEAHGYGPGPFIFLGSIAAIGAIGDARVLVRGGLEGTKRLSRHLWRMCFALFIAAMSVFLARAHIFPDVMRRTGMLYVLTFAPLVVMFGWLIRMRLVGRKARHGTRPTELPVRARRGYSLGDAATGERAGISTGV
jgi:uncharacterized membrane protein